MSLPVIGIVGRPNVGKSSFLNAALGRRVAIVHDKPGVTRDRVTADMTWGERTFELVDMGGIGIVDDQSLDREVEMQIATAIAGANVLVLVLDAREGIMPLDRRVADVIRRQSKPVVLLANKVDGEQHRTLVPELEALGLGTPLEISALHGYGISDVLDVLVSRLPPRRDDEVATAEGEVLIALVGQRNAGKSTLLNALVGEERVIVSEVPGTTRDAVDVRLTFGDRTFTVIDTAGFRKKRRLEDSIEFYGQVRSVESIRRAHVVLLLIDAKREVSQVDKQIASEILEARKPCVLVVNKWDLAVGQDPEIYEDYLNARLPLLSYAPIAFVSAQDRLRLSELVDVAFDLADQAACRVPTPALNKVVAAASAIRGPRVTRGRYPKIYYATQVGIHPPWIVLFVNDPALFKGDFKRFLENRFREAFPFSEIPIRISFRQRASLYR